MIAVKVYAPMHPAMNHYLHLLKQGVFAQLVFWHYNIFHRIKEESTMPMDGLTLQFVARELNDKLAQGRIDKVAQPEKDELVLLIRSQGENHRLLLCASPNNARAHITAQTLSNPMEPPMFCMLMRKHLLGGHVLAVRQIDGDRVLHVEIENADELGVMTPRTLILEIMGRHSNLIAVDAQGKIIDSIRHVGHDMSRVREVLPGLPYESPPAQDKLDPTSFSKEEAAARLSAQNGRLDKALASVFRGLSSVAAQEIAYRMTGSDKALMEESDISTLSQKLWDFMNLIPSLAPPVLQRDQDGEAIDVFPFSYLSRDTSLQTACGTISQALDAFFSTRDQLERISQKSASLNRLLKTHIERCEKKLALQLQELENSARMEEYRMLGDLINSNLYQLHKGQETARLQNFYDPDGGTIDIVLDKQLSPAQNAQRYFKRYQKARAARETAAEQKEKTLVELSFLEGALDDLNKCIEESELSEIRQEMQKAGYIRASHSRKPQRKLPESRPFRYESRDGIEILVGKNSLQNDRITSDARGDETWLHAKDMPGSHVIIRKEGEIPESTLLEAAQLAAYYSRGRQSAGVPIDYTLRKYVKKPGGSPAGFVIYTNQRTLYITVSESDIKKIKEFVPGK
jgi:predicted ribosome quality control (RQC) complex YloA/Tae2 family protein